MTAWQPRETAPEDGTPIWAYLNDMGIRLVRWGDASEWAEKEGGDPTDYISCFVEVTNEDAEWGFKYWLPENALSKP